VDSVVEEAAEVVEVRQYNLLMMVVVGLSLGMMLP
jgi:hypothetical protein